MTTIKGLVPNRLMLIRNWYFNEREAVAAGDGAFSNLMDSRTLRIGIHPKSSSRSQPASNTVLRPRLGRFLYSGIQFMKGLLVIGPPWRTSDKASKRFAYLAGYFLKPWNASLSHF